MTMPQPPPAVLASGITSPVSLGGAHGDGTPGVSAAVLDAGVGVLAMTGARPGTLFLALAGLVSLIAGGAMSVTGRKLTTRNTATAGLRDLSRLGAAAG